MNRRQFGKTDLSVSEVGFGAWAIGGVFMAGNTPLGWGETIDSESRNALMEAADRGINFYDTADFYGLGHSENLIGEVFGKNPEMVIATKVGHRLDENEKIFFDYSRDYILKACEESLRRLKRDWIDYYQLHTARMNHLENGECLEALEILQRDGKIRYWGISLNTYNPFPEADFMMNKRLGDGFQLVLNIINQRALPIVHRASQSGFGIIARMPLQFGLLTGKFTGDTTFDEKDHRHFRLKLPMLKQALEDLKPLWNLAKKYDISLAQLALSYILSYPEISTVIPGIRTAEQAKENSTGIVQLEKDDIDYLEDLYEERLKVLLDRMEKEES
ncbi:MAG: aldo/keto reductase [Calditrichaeota bacterium]|nr:aldo/keto reductase [Calditrichota bacterium]RQW07575.1 MAG: aldo/keto reductase [Calditrichota bacterium]